MSAWSPFRYRARSHAVDRPPLFEHRHAAAMQAVGAAWMMVELDASPAIVALVQTATDLPVVVVGVAAGAAADLVERRRLLLLCRSACSSLPAGGASGGTYGAGCRHTPPAPRLHLRARPGHGLQLPGVGKGHSAGTGAEKKKKRLLCSGRPTWRCLWASSGPVGGRHRPGGACPACSCPLPRPWLVFACLTPPPRSLSFVVLGAGSGRWRRTWDRPNASPQKGATAQDTRRAHAFYGGAGVFVCFRRR